jgi:hypothetical protein
VKKTVQNEKVEDKLIVRPVQGIRLCCVLMNMSEEKTVQNEKVEVKLIVRAVQGICLCCVLMNMSKKNSPE